MGRVSGNVTQQRQPVAGASIVFTLEGQPAEVFYGISNEAGKYIVDVGAKRGLPPGRYQVLVTDHVKPDGTSLPAGEEGQVMRQSGQAVERRFSLSKDVAAGENQIDLKLEEAQPVAAEE